MAHTRTHADETVTTLYRMLGINQPSQLSPDNIAYNLGIELVYAPVSSVRINRRIYLDSRISAEEQRQQFGHELCHVLWHPDNQLCLPRAFIDMQERQADNFALHACMPTDMVLGEPLPSTESEAAGVLSEAFKVTPEFALKRLRSMANLMYQTTEVT